MWGWGHGASDSLVDDSQKGYAGDKDAVVQDVWGDSVPTCFIKCKCWKMYPKQDVTVSYSAIVDDDGDAHGTGWVQASPPPHGGRHMLLSTRTETLNLTPRGAVEKGWMCGARDCPGQGRRDHLSLYSWKSVGGVYLLGSLGPFRWGC